MGLQQPPYQWGPVPGAETQAWVRSALSIPVAAIAANNAIQLQLDPRFYIDRMEVELAYSSQAASDLLFADGFDPAATLEPLRSLRATAELAETGPSVGLALASFSCSPSHLW